VRIRAKRAPGPSDYIIWQFDQIQGVNYPRNLKIKPFRLTQRLGVSVFIKVSLTGIAPVAASTGFYELPETDMRLEERWPRIVAQETAM
jgi:hypothetical protein